MRIYQYLGWSCLLLLGAAHAQALSPIPIDFNKLTIQPSPKSAEVFSPRFWVNVAPSGEPSIPGGMDQVQALGVAGVRLDLTWKAIEIEKGKYDFSKFDSIVKDFQRRNLRIILILDYSNPLYIPTERAPNQIMEYQAFASFATAAAAHYSAKGIVFEIWNEPNTSRFWSPTPNANDYGQLVRQAVDAIHAVRPGAQILLGGMAGIDGAFILKTLKATRGIQGISAIAVHPYYDPPEVIPKKLAHLKSQLKQAGITLPIWDGESGYTSFNYRGNADGHTAASRQRQAIYILRKYLVLWLAGTPVSVLYNLHDNSDDANDGESNFGILDFNYKMKPAYNMLQVLSYISKDRKLTGELKGLPDNLFGILLKGNRDKVYILWKAQLNKSTNIKFSTAQPITIKDASGAEKQKQWCVSDKEQNFCTIQLNEVDGPIYIRVVDPPSL